jgi:LEA14-like dessication related protein
MKTTTVALVAIGGFLAYQIFKVYNAVNTVQLVFNGITAQSVTTYTLNFIIQNVTNVAANLNAITGSVFMNGTNIGAISNFSPVAVPAAGQVSVNVTLQVSVLGLSSQLMSLLQNGAAGATVEVKGNMNVDSLIIPFDETL